jgi:hypothetical protein
MLKVRHSRVQSFTVLASFGWLISQMPVDFLDDSAAIKGPHSLEFLYREVRNFDFEFRHSRDFRIIGFIGQIAGPPHLPPSKF